MDTMELRRRVVAALRQVKGPSGEDILLDGHVQDIAVDAEGVVRFHFGMRAQDPGTLVKEAREAVQSVDGVARVKIDVKLPQAAPSRPQPQHPGSRKGMVPPPTPQPDLLPNVRRVIAVSSGKGGVGKSTVAVNLAAALAAAGHSVGLLDADVYGPDVPLMFGETRKPRVTGTAGQEKIVPLEAHGVKLMSIGFLLDAEQPAIMRGPMISGILKQFIEQVEWGPLDYMIVDMPPGTGDAQLSLVQTIDLDGAVMVTTPQEVSTGDVRRAIRMFERVNTRILGVVENMSGFVCPSCDEVHDIFGRGGGEALAGDMKVPFLGAVPLDPRVRVAGDEGQPTAVSAPGTPAAEAFGRIAQSVAAAVAESMIRA